MYPKSLLIPYLKGPVEEVNTYHENFKKDHEEVKFMNVPDEINTTAKFFPFLKNDKISYIDMWATWCMPCRMELKYAIPLHDDFEKIGVNVIYLSFDNAKDKGKWENMAKSLVLKGTNIIASKALRDNLYKSLKNFNGIPRYVILSPDGELLEEDAKRPTDNLELLSQLKQYADKYNKK